MWRLHEDMSSSSFSPSESIFISKFKAKFRVIFKVQSLTLESFVTRPVWFQAETQK
jgi:hypothetical protein